MNFLRTATFVSLALAALLTGASAQAVAVNGGISGQVTDEFGNPIEGAWVEAFQFVGCCAQGGALTGADGTYSIEGLPAESYRVYASADGHVAEFYDDTIDITQSVPVAVSEGTITPNIDFALSSGGSITGQVTDEHSVPIEGAFVDALLAEGCCSFGVTTTAADGTYAIEGLSGSYLVFASASGFASEYYDDTIDTSLATPVTVGSGSDASGIDFVLSSCNTPWTQPAGDDDCDGFDSESEQFSGTDPMLMCNADTTPNNESPDAWPADFDDNQASDILDVLTMKPHFNTSSPDPSYSARHDLDTDNDVDIMDVLAMKPFFNQSCT